MVSEANLNEKILNLRISVKMKLYVDVMVKC